MNVIWNDIEKLYSPLSASVTKGTQISIIIKCNKTIDQINKNLQGGFFNGWTFPSKGKYIKPFKLVSIEFSKENEIEAKIILIRKDQEIDELRLFRQDVLDILNTDHINICSWENRILG
ncbi:hypothetical protein [Paenibacillus anseongense]|uniref:hypothetical protein n=1 Tax=Paenibacillus anseongense TaxID=2682845 RepID=UPI002DB57738|nr:hypothetical protein [Paenibacillus anseongense]MEC0264541.1 hypothetical protein [Paenibacillus anseongense]